jgi:hypothetical protein
VLDSVQAQSASVLAMEVEPANATA